MCKAMNRAWTLYCFTGITIILLFVLRNPRRGITCSGQWTLATTSDMQVLLALTYIDEYGDVSKPIITNLVGGLEHFLCFHILGIIIPTDFHIFRRGRSTTNQ